MPILVPGQTIRRTNEFGGYQPKWRFTVTAAIALYRWRIRIFYFQPKRRAAPAIGRAEAFAHNALATETASLAKYGSAVRCSDRSLNRGAVLPIGPFAPRSGVA